MTSIVKADIGEFDNSGYLEIGDIPEADITFTGSAPADFLNASYRVSKIGNQVQLRGLFTYDSGSSVGTTGISFLVPKSACPEPAVNGDTNADSVIGYAKVYDGTNNRTYLFLAEFTWNQGPTTSRIGLTPANGVWTGLGVQAVTAEILYQSN